MKKITTKLIAEAFVESLDDKLVANDARVEGVYKLLKKNKLGSKLPKFLKDVEEILDKKEGIINVNVTTKNKLPESVHEKIKKDLLEKYKTKNSKEIKSSDIKIEEIIDEKVLGGIKIKVGDEVWDNTVAGRLNELTNLITK